MGRAQAGAALFKRQLGRCRLGRLKDEDLLGRTLWKVEHFIWLSVRSEPRRAFEAVSIQDDTPEKSEASLWINTRRADATTRKAWSAASQRVSPPILPAVLTPSNQAE